MPLRRPTIAIAAHVYYAELWPELAAMIRQVPYPFTLFVTLPDGADFEAQIHREFPQAIVRPVVNVGRDIAPFLSLLPELKDFDLVCKLHTKRDIPLYRPWRIEALRGVLGGPPVLEQIVSAFAETPALAMAGSGALFIDGPYYMYLSRERLLAFQPDLPANFGFFAGTYFWARPSVFADFHDAFPTSAFIPHRDGDGQLEHAIERLFGVRAATVGGLVGLTRVVGGTPSLDLIPASEPLRFDFNDVVHVHMAARYANYPTDWYEQPDLIAGRPLGSFDLEQK